MLVVVVVGGGVAAVVVVLLFGIWLFVFMLIFVCVFFGVGDTIVCGISVVVVLLLVVPIRVSFSVQFSAIVLVALVLSLASRRIASLFSLVISPRSICTDGKL